MAEEQRIQVIEYPENSNNWLLIDTGQLFDQGYVVYDLDLDEPSLDTPVGYYAEDDSKLIEISTDDPKRSLLLSRNKILQKLNPKNRQESLSNLISGMSSEEAEETEVEEAEESEAEEAEESEAEETEEAETEETEGLKTGETEEFPPFEPDIDLIGSLEQEVIPTLISISDVDVKRTLTFEETILESKVIEDHTTLLSTLKGALQNLGQTEKMAESWTRRYLQLSNQAENQVRQIKNENPIINQKYQNPTKFHYLTNDFNQPWLIPIINDVKDVYDLQLAESPNERYISLSKTLNEEIKNFYYKGSEKTDFMQNDGWTFHRHIYHYPDDQPSHETFKLPDLDRQDYTIHVMRKTKNKLIRRKVMGQVFKKRNHYADEIGKKHELLTMPIIHTDHILSARGEMLDIIGFTVTSPNFNWLKTREIESIEGANLTQLQKQAFSVMLTSNEITNIFFDKAIPNMSNIDQIYQPLLSLIDNLAQLDRLLYLYQLDIKHLPEDKYQQLVKLFRDRIEQERASKSVPSELLKIPLTIIQLPSILQSIKTSIPDYLLDAEDIKDCYGIYQQRGKSEDVGINRLLWIEKKVDQGQLFALITQLDQLSDLCDLYSSDCETDDQLTPNTFKKQIKQLDQQISQLNEQVSTSDYILTPRAQKLTELSHQTYAPLIYVDQPDVLEPILSVINPLLPDASNIYMYQLQEQRYLPRTDFLEQYKIKQIKLYITVLQQLRDVFNHIDTYTETIYNRIDIARNQYQLLKNNYRLSREQLWNGVTDTKVVNVRSGIKELFERYVAMNQIHRAVELIHNGELNANKTKYVTRKTHEEICCPHYLPQLLELHEQLKTYYDDSLSCRLCHQIIGQEEYDDVEGYTEEGGIERVADQAIDLSDMQTMEEIPEFKCQQFTDPSDLQACHVIRYLNQVVPLNDQQMFKALELYNKLRTVNGFGLYTNDDINSNVQLREQIDNTIRNLSKEKDEKKIMAYRYDSIQLKFLLDSYLLICIAAIVVFLWTHKIDPKTLLIQFTKLHQYNWLSDLNDQQTELYSFLQEDRELILKKLKIRKIYTLEADPTVWPNWSDYVSTKLPEYLNKVQLLDFVKTPSIEHEEETKDKSDLFNIPTEPEPQTITQWTYENYEEYLDLLKNIEIHLNYYHRQRNAIIHNLLVLSNQLLDSDLELSKQMVQYPINKKCPTKLRIIYLDYLNSINDPNIDEPVEPLEYLVDNHVIKINRKDLTRKAYTMSQVQKPDDLIQLESHRSDESLQQLRQRLAQTDEQINNLQKHRNQLIKKNSLEPQFATYNNLIQTTYSIIPDVISSNQTQSKPDVHVISTEPIETETKVISSNTTLELIQVKINKLLEILINCQIVNDEEDKDVYRKFLNELGNAPQYFEDLRQRLIYMNDPFNLQWSNLTINQRLHDHNLAIQYFQRDKILSYFDLLHNLISTLYNKPKISIVEQSELKIILNDVNFGDDINRTKALDDYQYIKYRNDLYLDTPNKTVIKLKDQLLTELIQHYEYLKTYRPQAVNVYCQLIQKYFDIIKQQETIYNVSATQIETIKRNFWSERMKKYHTIRINQPELTRLNIAKWGTIRTKTDEFANKDEIVVIDQPEIVEREGTRIPIDNYYDQNAQIEGEDESQISPDALGDNYNYGGE